jgi:hypothetical protein
MPTRHSRPSLLTFIPPFNLAVRSDRTGRFRRIEYFPVGCGQHGPRDHRLRATFDQPATCVSDHHGVVADAIPAPK